MSTINTIDCRVAELKDAIREITKLGFVPMIWGPPGIGKSESVQQLATEDERALIDVRLSQKIASDIGGLPALDHEAGRTTFYLPDFLPSGEKPTYLFFDEINGSDIQTRIASYGLILERRINGYSLPDNCHIIAAGNREEDGSMAPPFERAMNSRFVHLIAKPDIEGWLEWAMMNDIAPEVMAFLKTHVDYLMPSDKDIADDVAIAPNPRSWARVSQIVKNVKDERLQHILVTGVIGDRAAAPFFITAKELAQLRSIQDILNTPTEKLHNVLPDTAAGLYAFGYAINAALSKENYPHVLRVLNALDEITDKKYAHLPMQETQSFAMGMVLDKLAAMCPESYADPSFMAYNKKRNAQNGA